MNDIEKARYDQRQRERQRDAEEQRNKIHELRMAEFKVVENKISPLTFAPQDEDASQHRQLTRSIVTEDGERVGTLSFKQDYSWKQLEGWYNLSSRRIPQHGRYRWGDGTRRYKKVSSVIVAIKKFCMAVSNDEERATVLQNQLDHYHEVLRNANKRSRRVSGRGYGAVPVDGFIDLLASDIPQDVREGEEFLRVLIRKRRVNKRFSTWVVQNFIKPRKEELDKLDTSKVVVRN